MVELSKLKAVDLREVWMSEARDFTPWLAKNIEQLGEVLGMDLEVDATEAEVGSFSLDLLARDLGTDRAVVIENQLESTNHDHLGKLLTYAARYEAHTVVWLVREFRPEHRAAMDWLNQRTGEDTAFFGVVVEAWTIDESRAAPRFVPITFPNDWQKQSVRGERGSGAGQVSERGKRYQRFFQALIDTLRDEHRFTSAEKGQPQNWYHFTSTFNGMPYNASLDGNGNAVAGVYIQSDDWAKNKARFDRLMARRQDIESAIGYSLEWERRDDIKASLIQVTRKGSIDDDDETLEEIRAWMIERLLELKQVLPKYLEDAVSIGAEPSPTMLSDNSDSE